MLESLTVYTKQDKAMVVWLFSVAAMVLFMVILGGLTRLTHSGLSIVEWKLFTGWIPPLNDADWATLFDKYQNFPQFHKTNPLMDVDGFKGIFWLEYIHRVWGRLLGFAFFLPFAVFVIKGWVRVRDGLFWKLLGLLILGASQGVMGWFMVMSGLVDRPDVSQYRLTAHFGLALLIVVALIWVGLGLRRKNPHDPYRQDAGGMVWGARLVFLMTFLTALSGGFVAGLDAGFAYNTFPLMAGDWVPLGVYDYDPWMLAPFEDLMTVQFNHRWLAITTFVVIIVFWGKGQALHLAPSTRLSMHVLLAVAILQVTLGISTLILVVPVALASMHQIGAVLLVCVATWCAHEWRAPVKK